MAWRIRAHIDTSSPASEVCSAPNSPRKARITSALLYPTATTISSTCCPDRCWITRCRIGTPAIGSRHLGACHGSRRLPRPPARTMATRSEHDALTLLLLREPKRLVVRQNQCRRPDDAVVFDEPELGHDLIVAVVAADMRRIGQRVMEQDEPGRSPEPDGEPAADLAGRAIDKCDGVGGAVHRVKPGRPCLPIWHVRHS